jgi:choline dehydrogenase
MSFCLANSILVEMQGLRVTGGYDIVILGGGAAGCVLANRLSRDPDRRVLLIEAGPVDRHPMIHMPKGVGKVLADPGHVWAYPVHAGNGDNRPPKPWLRGRVLGGSSSVNGMMYVRGQPADFDAIAEETSADWNWSEIGRIYREVEDHVLGQGDGRGTDGLLGISLPPADNAAMEALIASGPALGMAAVEDFNAPDDRERIGYCPQTIRRGRRQSAAAVFLTPVRNRPNLTVRTGLTIDRILFDGVRATGVEVCGPNGAERIAGARFIVSAGTFGSPAILQRSGIGDAARLAALGIVCRADRPEVGRNLREHCGLTLQWRLRPGTSRNAQYSGWRVLWNGLRYYLTRGGPLAIATFELGAALRTRPDAARPDAQLLAVPHSLDRSRATMAMEPFPGMQMVVYPLRPRATGEVHITSSNPLVLPDASLDFFGDLRDRIELVDTVRAVRRLVAAKPIAELVVEETRPGPNVETDDQILDAYREMGIPAYHAAGTCRMGADSDSVVDPLTRVRGVEGVHVVDLSIAPQIPSGNTFAPVVAMAWRAAELIEREGTSAPARAC